MQAPLHLNNPVCVCVCVGGGGGGGGLALAHKTANKYLISHMGFLLIIIAEQEARQIIVLY